MRPVEKVELSEKHIKLRVIILILAILAVIGSTIFIVVTLSSKEKGWTRIELSRNSLDGSYYFYYDLSDDATSEYKKLTNVYKANLEKAYMLFDTVEEYEDVNNVCYINKNYNKDIELDSILYNAIKKVVDNNSKAILLGGIVAYYDSMIIAKGNLDNYDPRYNQNIKKLFEDYIGYLNDKNHFELLLKDNNVINLKVSDEFKKLLDDYELKILDFNYLKNAFILDYLEEVLYSLNYRSGYIYSLDGYLLNLGSHIEYTYDILDDTGISTINKVAKYKYSEKRKIVCFKNVITNNVDYDYIRKLSDGSTRTYYIDSTDGFSKESIKYLCGYSSKSSLSDIALDMEKVYISDTFDNTKLSHDNNYIWINDKEISYDDEKLKFESVIDGYKANYVKKA